MGQATSMQSPQPSTPSSPIITDQAPNTRSTQTNDPPSRMGPQWTPVYAVVFLVLGSLNIPRADIAKAITTHFDGNFYMDGNRAYALWRGMCHDLPEWWRCIEEYPERHALELEVLDAVRDGAPKIPPFVRGIKSGESCTNADVDEVRVWLKDAGMDAAVVDDDSVMELGGRRA